MLRAAVSVMGVDIRSAKSQEDLTTAAQELACFAGSCDI